MDQGKKFDEDKTKWAYGPWTAFEAVLEVMHHGAEKYGWNNWRMGLSVSRLWSAAMRHLLAYLRGEDYDPDSGLHHIAHAATCCLFLLESILRGFGTDDRRLVTGQNEMESGSSGAVAGGVHYICSDCGRSREPGSIWFWKARGKEGSLHCGRDG